jgi:hypothetical protein
MSLEISLPPFSILRLKIGLKGTASLSRTIYVLPNLDYHYSLEFSLNKEK